MSELNANPEPKLAPPGAGLPWIEGLAFKYLIVPIQTRKNTWESCAERFKREGEKIISLASQVSEAQLGEKKLVPHLPGLEDSSRYWSIAMCMEHLEIVGKNMGKMITALTHDRDPGVIVDIAAVKPLGRIPPQESLMRFKNFISTHLPDLHQAIGDRNSSRKHFHPWTGPINAKQWYWLMSVHQSLHRKQVQLICEQLGHG